MKYFVLSVALMALACLTPLRSHCQVPGQIPQLPGPGDLDQQRDPLSRLNKMTADDERVRREMAKTNGATAPKLSKQDLERIKDMRKVDPADLEKYKDFLKNDKTGIFRLFPNMNCITPKLIRVDGECAQFIPGSSYFSFRSRQYSDVLNQDMGFVLDEMFSAGFFSQGIFVPIGNVTLETVSVDQPGVKYLADLQPDTEFAAARARAPQFRQGVQANGFTYASHAKAVVDNTYAFRLIAYKFGNTLSPLSPDTTALERLFLDLSFDKRVDSIIALRVVRLEPSGNATILWKELSRKEAPKLRFAKGEPYTDFK